MSGEERAQLFDQWAARYDEAVSKGAGFPFDGYDQVLEMIVESAATQHGLQVLDLGTGTGNLAKRFVDLGCAVWGVDFSNEMLIRAREKVPDAKFIQADILRDWPQAFPKCFDLIVSAYVLHEFALETKVSLIARLAGEHLTPGGRIVVGDIAFKDGQGRVEASQRWSDLWDEDEHYWSAEETMAVCKEAGLTTEYRQISSCGGVFVFKPQVGNASV